MGIVQTSEASAATAAAEERVENVVQIHLFRRVAEGLCVHRKEEPNP